MRRMLFILLATVLLGCGDDPSLKDIHGEGLFGVVEFGGQSFDFPLFEVEHLLLNGTTTQLIVMGYSADRSDSTFASIQILLEDEARLNEFGERSFCHADGSETISLLALRIDNEGTYVSGLPLCDRAFDPWGGNCVYPDCGSGTLSIRTLGVEDDWIVIDVDGESDDPAHYWRVNTTISVPVPKVDVLD